MRTSARRLLCRMYSATIDIVAWNGQFIIDEGTDKFHTFCNHTVRRQKYLHGVSFSPVSMFSIFHVIPSRQTEHILVCSAEMGNRSRYSRRFDIQTKSSFRYYGVVHGHDKNGGEMWMNSMFLFIRSTPSKGIGTSQHINTLESIRA